MHTNENGDAAEGLETVLDTLEHALTDVETLRAKVAALSAANATLEAEAADLRSQVQLAHAMVMRDAEKISTLQAECARLREALSVLVDHACETYPHFEDARGQRDIEQARRALASEGGRP